MLDSDMEEAVDELLQQNGNIAAASNGAAAGSDAALAAAAAHAGLSDDDSNGSEDLSNDGADSEEDNSAAHEAVDGLDYEAMLSAGSAGTQANGAQAAQDEQRSAQLLPTEDAFLCLADMDAFVRQGEAAEGLGDRGGLTQYDAALRRVARHDAAARGALGDDDADNASPGALGAAAPRSKKRARQQEAGADSDDEALEDAEHFDNEPEPDADSDVDLYQGSGGEHAGTRSDDDADNDGVMYDDFFGRQQKLPRPPAAHTQADAGDESTGGDEAGSAPDADTSDDATATAAPASAADAAGSAELTPHQRRVARMQEQIAAMEEAAMQGQEWHMRGEASAASRPKDSALELDLDFEQTLRPPPQPTIETATALEDMIKRRVEELRFDNVVRVIPAAPKEQKQALEFDDSRPRAGLADLYEGQTGAMAVSRAAKQDKIKAVRTCPDVHLRMTCESADGCGKAFLTLCSQPCDVQQPFCVAWWQAWLCCGVPSVMHVRVAAGHRPFALLDLIASGRWHGLRCMSEVQQQAAVPLALACLDTGPRDHSWHPHNSHSPISTRMRDECMAALLVLLL